MLGLDSVPVQCPYCWESLEIMVDSSAGDQVYTEDCQVCCRPMVIRVHLDAQGEPHADALSEEDSF
ncbi:CPXCG motif-containing cysteine-rich protein [Marinobacteraceae bacterium S3BR75-40.1]